MKRTIFILIMLALLAVSLEVTNSMEAQQQIAADAEAYELDLEEGAQE